MARDCTYKGCYLGAIHRPEEIPEEEWAIAQYRYGIDWDGLKEEIRQMIKDEVSAQIKIALQKGERTMPLKLMEPDVPGKDGEEARKHYRDQIGYEQMMEELREFVRQEIDRRGVSSGFKIPQD